MVSYRRNKIKGGSYFFTLTLSDRNSTLLIDHIENLKNAMQLVQQTMPYQIKSMVVLPEHLHAVWELLKGSDNYSARWRRIKTLFTQSLLKKGVSLQKDKRGEYYLWQRRYWEHTTRNEVDLERHINYIHYNPVKHCLVKQVKDWPHSTFHRYVVKGILARDWAGKLHDNEYGSFYGE